MRGIWSLSQSFTVIQQVALTTCYVPDCVKNWGLSVEQDEVAEGTVDLMKLCFFF
jgi:hypothetical protein